MFTFKKEVDPMKKKMLFLNLCNKKINHFMSLLFIFKTLKHQHYWCVPTTPPETKEP